jgi:hypothetical protein
MKQYVVVIVVLIAVCGFVTPAAAQNSTRFLRDDFNNMHNWKEMHFKNINNHTKYDIENERSNSYLRAESHESASGIVLKKEFNVFEYPKIRWRWKISNVFNKGNAREKSGDDYPLRVYIIFKYDPATASFGKKMRYGIVNTLYGEYPPDSSLNYIWANRPHTERIITNTYAAEAMMVILQEGGTHAGKWIEQEVNIVDDYHQAFRKDPPLTASIAIMSDSDNTGESAVAYIDFIEIFR